MLAPDRRRARARRGGWACASTPATCSRPAIALAPQAALDATLREFDRLHRPRPARRSIHANDSKRDRGSRVDRHEAIGKGKIGREAFRLLLNHPRLAGSR